VALMRADVFLVRRAGIVVAEPTAGADRYLLSPDPQRWWADVDPQVTAVAADDRHTVVVEVVEAFPEHGRIGRVVRSLGRAAPPAASERSRSFDIDEVFDCLDRIPDAWLPYEVRVAEVPGAGLDAFVGTLLPVPTHEICEVLGTRWRDVVRVEPWLMPS
jgi:hypothetical protein